MCSGKRRVLILALLIAACVSPWVGEGASEVPDRLTPHPQLWRLLEASPFGEPLYVQSEEHGDLVRVSVYGLFERPFAETARALTSPAEWCDFTPLHNAISACIHGPVMSTTWLTFHLKPSTGIPLANTYEWRYGFRVMERGDDYVHVVLDTATGPLDTHSFRIVLEAVPHADSTLVRIDASYRPSLWSKTVLGTYASTFGRRKYGFSVVGHDKEGNTVYVRGRKALFERVVMRGYLALEAYLDTLHAPENKRFEVRLERWLELTQRFPQQLQDIDPEEYLDTKRRERQEQHLLQAVF